MEEVALENITQCRERCFNLDKCVGYVYKTQELGSKKYNCWPKAEMDPSKERRNDNFITEQMKKYCYVGGKLIGEGVKSSSSPWWPNTKKM